MRDSSGIIATKVKPLRLYEGPMSKQNDDLYKKWDAWFDVLDTEILHLHTQRYIYNEVIEMVRNKPVVQEGNAFLEWVFFWYSSSISVSVRRQADKSTNSISYLRLLEGIQRNPLVISRDRFIANFADSNYSDDDAALCFEQLVGTGATHLDASVVQQEIDALVAKTFKLKHYVDKRIAHHDQSDPVVVPNFSDLDEALDYLGDLHKRYHGLFRCFDLVQLIPTYQYDWKRPFHYPWLGS